MSSTVSTTHAAKLAAMDVSTDDMEDMTSAPLTPPRLVRRSGEISPLRSGPWPISPVAVRTAAGAGVSTGPTGTPVRPTGPTGTPVGSFHSWGFTLAETPTTEQAEAVASRFTAAIGAAVATPPGAPRKAPRRLAAAGDDDDDEFGIARRLALEDIQLGEVTEDDKKALNAEMFTTFQTGDFGIPAGSTSTTSVFEPRGAGLFTVFDPSQVGVPADDMFFQHSLAQQAMAINNNNNNNETSDSEYDEVSSEDGEYDYVPSVAASPAPAVYGRKRVYALPPTGEDEQ